MYILYFLLWIIFNGKITLEITIFGIVISAAIYMFFCKFFDWSFKKDLMILRCTGFIIQYLFVLIAEIFKANLAALKIIFSNKKREPVLVSFEVPIKTKICRVLFANSITITPGTITVTLEDNLYVVHCLDKSLAEGIEDSVFLHLIEKIERVGSGNDW